MSKLAIAERMIRSISPAAEILGIDKRVEANESLDVLKRADVVFGCLDDEGPRFMLNSVCAEYGKRLIDVATEIIPARNGEPVRYGGRVFVLWERPGCLVCCDLIDMEEAKRQLASSAEQENRRSVYGVNREDLNGVGPSVAPLNGTIASIATTEFLLAITGLRHPIRLTTYRADLGRFTVAKDSPRQGCYTCLSATPLS
jgi:molybdopterin/thiamine biosynthesis adenylyltransferase